MFYLGVLLLSSIGEYEAFVCFPSTLMAFHAGTGPRSCNFLTVTCAQLIGSNVSLRDD